MSTAPFRTTADASDAAASGSASVASNVEALFRAHYPHLRGYGRRLTSDEQLVEDAIQDVFLQLCQRPDDAAPLEHPRSYLLTSVRRRILERLDAADRRRSRNEKYVVDEPAFSVSRADVDAAHDLVMEQRDDLKAALDSLSDRRREALYLRFYHGLRYREIGEVMNIRSQSARNYVSEALHHLRDLFKGL